MDKVVITGGTYGLGAELSKIYTNSVKLSRRNGHDISCQEDRAKIIKECNDANIIFNNAHCGFFQVELLYDLYAVFKDTNKIIVNISSDSPETSIHRPHKYAIEKLALDKAVMQLNSHSECRIVLVKPSLFDSPRSRAIKGHKMKAQYVAQQIYNNLNSDIIKIQ